MTGLTSVTAFLRPAPAGPAVPRPGRDYGMITGTGLVAASGVITLPLPPDDGALGGPLRLAAWRERR